MTKSERPSRKLVDDKGSEVAADDQAHSESMEFIELKTVLNTPIITAATTGISCSEVNKTQMICFMLLPKARQTSAK